MGEEDYQDYYLGADPGMYDAYATDSASDPNSPYYDPGSGYYDPSLDPNSPWYDSSIGAFDPNYVPLTDETASGLVLREDSNPAPDQLMPTDASLSYADWANPDQYSGLGNVAGHTGGDQFFPWMAPGGVSGGGGGGGGSIGPSVGTSISPKAAAAASPLAAVGTDLTKLLGQILGVKLTQALMPQGNSAALPATSISPATGNNKGAATIFGGGSGNGPVAGIADYLNNLTTTQKVAGLACVVGIIYLLRRSPAPAAAPANVVYLPAPARRTPRRARRAA